MRRLITRALEKTESYKTLLLWNSWQYSRDEEIRLLPRYVNPYRNAIDIGAADGVFSYRLSKLARRCITFEPNPHSCARLRAALGDRIDLYEAAASSETGSAELRVPVVNGTAYRGWGTISKEPFREIPDCETTNVVVKKVRPDELRLGDVGFIKIDVEGHELSVLKGLSKILINSRPHVLIELRDYDGTTDQAKALFADLNYTCAFTNKINWVFSPRTNQPTTVQFGEL